MTKALAIVLALSVSVPVMGAGALSAAPDRRDKFCDSYCKRFPSASPRQLKNARAYDNGNYYERDSNAHPVGSRSWWYLKEQEGGRGGFRF